MESVSVFMEQSVQQPTKGFAQSVVPDYHAILMNSGFTSIQFLIYR